MIDTKLRPATPDHPKVNSFLSISIPSSSSCNTITIIKTIQIDAPKEQIYFIFPDETVKQNGCKIAKLRFNRIFKQRIFFFGGIIGLFLWIMIMAKCGFGEFEYRVGFNYGLIVK